VDDPAGASSQQREECRCGLLLTVEVPAEMTHDQNWKLEVNLHDVIKRMSGT